MTKRVRRFSRAGAVRPQRQIKSYVAYSTAAVLAACVLVLPSHSAAGAEGSSSEGQFKPPSYNVLRHNEDWSGLVDVDRSGLDGRDSMKYIPLTDGGAAWVGFGGQLRERVEVWSDFGFGATPGGVDNDDVFLLSRLLLHADLHLGEHVRVFVQGKSSLSTDRDLAGGRRTLDVDELAMQNGFVDLSTSLADGGRALLRTGRQELLLGKQRLVSPLDWANTRRTFDGVSGSVAFNGWQATGFWTRPVVIRKYDSNSANDSQEFMGVYAARKAPDSRSGQDVYWLRLNRDMVTFNDPMGTPAKEERDTVGVRLWGNPEGTNLDYDVEAAYQFGDIGSNDIEAYMVSSDVGMRMDGEYKARFFVGLDYASGDNSEGGDVETFNQLFPLGHAYHGWMDFIGRQNIIDARLGVSAKPRPKLTVIAKAHHFRRADDDDAVYNAGGGVLRAGSAGTSSDVGVEVDVLAKYQCNRHLSIGFGYSHFFSGDFIEESGSGSDVDFFYVPVQYTF